MKHFGIVVVALVLLAGTSVFAESVNKMAANNIRAEADNVIVPIELSNSIPMTAMDLPLKFSEGVTLVDVSFEGTRSENFDFKWANINNEEHTVVIGLIPMVYGENSDLEAGEGAIANLEFRIDSEDLEVLEVETTTMDKPSHELMFVYADEDANMKESKPEFPVVEIELAKILDKIDPLPTTFALRQNAPNPFNPSTRVDYDLPHATNVRMDIYNVLGQKVKTLVDGFQEAGFQSITWNGTNDNGSTVASGMYFYRIEADEFSETKKMMMLK